MGVDGGIENGQGKGEWSLVPCSVRRLIGVWGDVKTMVIMTLKKGKVYEKRWIGWGRGGLGGMGRYVIVKKNTCSS